MGFKISKEFGIYPKWFDIGKNTGGFFQTEMEVS